MRRKGATNVVATMLIFGIMITSVGVLYSQIAPTLLGYETTTTSTNQSHIFESIANEVQRLSTATVGSVGRVHIVADQTRYDISTGRNLQVDVVDGTGSLISENTDVNEFKAFINGSFQPRTPDYLNRITSEDFHIVNNTGASLWVLTSEYDYSEGEITLYFRSHLSVYQSASGVWKVTILIYKIDFLTTASGTTPLVFPVELDEWTLRLRKQATTVTSGSFVVSGSLQVTHEIDGVAGTTYSFPGIPDGASVDVNIVTNPFLFSI